MALLALLIILLLTQPGLPSSQQFNKTTPALEQISFSASIIHRDAPASPFYNPNLTFADRRHRYFKKSLTDLGAPVYEESGEYVMTYYIGSPPVKTYGIIDTGSNLVWLQCEPCKPCLKQKMPIFHPLDSSTFKYIMYGDARCSWLPDGGRPNEWNHCIYVSGYVDGSSSEGHLSTETLWFDKKDGTSKIALPNVVFGCANKNLEIEKEDVYPPGIIGLDRSNLSLVVQLGVSKFSYCLSPVKETKINFGSSALMIGDRIPLLNINDLYYVTITGISIQTYFDYQRLAIPPNAFDLTTGGGGGVIVDSGTPITRLPVEVMKILTSNLKDRLSSEAYYPHENELCFHGTLRDIEEDSNPKVIIHFNGTDLTLSSTTLWIRDPKGWCLAILPTDKDDDGTSTIGSFQLENHNVGYDLIDNVLTLQPMDCSTNAQGQQHIDER